MQGPSVRSGVSWHQKVLGRSLWSDPEDEDFVCSEAQKEASEALKETDRLQESI